MRFSPDLKNKNTFAARKARFGSRPDAWWKRSGPTQLRSFSWHYAVYFSPLQISGNMTTTEMIDKLKQHMNVTNEALSQVVILGHHYGNLLSACKIAVHQIASL